MRYILARAATSDFRPISQWNPGKLSEFRDRAYLLMHNIEMKKIEDGTFFDDKEERDDN